MLELVNVVVAASTYNELELDEELDAGVEEEIVQSNQALPFSEGQAKLPDWYPAEVLELLEVVVAAFTYNELDDVENVDEVA